MNFFIEAYNTILFYPLFNLSLWIYNSLPIKDFGIVVILITLIVKAILLPFETGAQKQQKKMKDIQPKVEEIQKKFKDDKEVQAKALMDLYQQEKLNPFASISGLFIQLPFLWAIFQMFNLFAQHFATGKWAQTPFLYPGIALPAAINYNFLSILDLSKTNLYLAFGVVILQIIQMSLVSGVNVFKKAKNPEERMMKNMNIFFMASFVLILVRLPSALSLYFLVSIIASLIVQKTILSKS
ncbi:MAG: YidC/Oxa1 family membrane protein insertase [Candidatus Paceibacterota bacterium]